MDKLNKFRRVSLMFVNSIVSIYVLIILKGLEQVYDVAQLLTYTYVFMKKKKNFF